jgi:hypothetical protein
MFKKKIWKRKFALTQGGPPRLELFSEEGEWKNVSVRLDGKEIGIVSRGILEKGYVEFNLGNGSILRFQLPSDSIIGFFTGPFNSNPEITFDGKVLYEHVTPIQFLKYAYNSIFLISGFGLAQLIISILLYFTSTQQASDFLNRAITSFVISLIFLILGFMVRSRSKTALSIAIVLFSIDFILYLWNLITQFNIQSFDLRLTIGSIAIRIILFLFMFIGFSAVDDLKKGIR